MRDGLEAVATVEGVRGGAVLEGDELDHVAACLLRASDQVGYSARARYLVPRTVRRQRAGWEETVASGSGAVPASAHERADRVSAWYWMVAGGMVSQASSVRSFTTPG